MVILSSSSYHVIKLQQCHLSECNPVICHIQSNVICSHLLYPVICQKIVKCFKSLRKHPSFDCGTIWIYCLLSNVNLRKVCRHLFNVHASRLCFVFCLVFHVCCFLSDVSCLVSHFLCIMSSVWCLVSYVWCIMSDVFCLWCPVCNTIFPLSSHCCPVSVVWIPMGVFVLCMNVTSS